MAVKMGHAVTGIAVFILIELILLGSSFVIMGGFGFEPLPIALGIAESFVGDTSITVIDMAVGWFIVGSFVNLLVTMWVVAFRRSY